MDQPVVYIPMDRRQAMARGASLPEQTFGAALFADISGFTPLTEALARALGPQRGAEELTRYLNLVYDALIAEVDRYGGSVLSFAGDAITCWFDHHGPDGLEPEANLGQLLAAHRAATCALAMQQAMQHFTSLPVPDGTTVGLAMKVAVAAGSVRRFLVGDPAIQLLDVLAGATLERLAAAEHLAKPGEIVLDPTAASLLGCGAFVSEWRGGNEDPLQFAVVEGLPFLADPRPWPPLSQDALDEAAARPWVLAPIFERARSGQGVFLAELRPAVALFLRFTGIDYDAPEATEQLNRYMAWVLAIVNRYGGYLLQLAVGDKGSYFYVAFGAPIAHDDDEARAARTALELRTPPAGMEFIQTTQMGITRGRMRAGPYGGATRRTYGVLGDDVNLSARLMQAAANWQILTTARVAQTLQLQFVVEELPPIQVKGKAEPVAVYALTDLDRQAGLRFQEPLYRLPMVGRTSELDTLEHRLEDTRDGDGQIVAVVAEAGLGKSRLLAEATRAARERGLAVYGGAAQSFGTNSSYMVWEGVWQGFFDVDPDQPADVQIRRLEGALAAIDPTFLPRLPLLAAVLTLSIPDNDLTRSFDPKLRKASLEALLVDCVRARARRVPVVFVLEDAHWIDPLSRDLLDAISRTIGHQAVCIFIAMRPPPKGEDPLEGVRSLAYFTEMPLADFTPEEAKQLIELKLQQLYGAAAQAPALFVTLITERAQGNPFYVEELINYLNDRGIDPTDRQALATLDLPASLQSLILSRIDQLSESQKVTIKVASIIGRLFRFRWLWGAYPELGAQERVKGDLDVLDHMDLTPLDQLEPELIYIFKNALTQEATSESLLAATRAMLHGQLAAFIEQSYADSVDQYYDLLAYHYDQSARTDKRREYLRKAGDAARDRFANVAAMDYYQRLLPLLDEADRVAVLDHLGQVQELVGQWQAARAQYQLGLEVATRLNDRPAQTRLTGLMGGLSRKQGDYAEAMTWLARARDDAQDLGDMAGVSQALAAIGDVHRLKGEYAQARQAYDDSLAYAGRVDTPRRREGVRAAALKAAGTLAAYQGDYAQSRSLFEESLAIVRDQGDKPNTASLLNNLGIIARYEGDYAMARSRFEESLILMREIGDPMGTASALNNLALLVRTQGDNAEARRLLEESLDLKRQLGEKWGIANTLSSLGDVLIDLEMWAEAREALIESLRLNGELGDRTALAFVLEFLASLAAAAQRAEAALRLGGAAEALRESLGATLAPQERAKLERRLDPARVALGADAAGAAWQAGRDLSLDEAVALAGRTRYVT